MKRIIAIILFAVSVSAGASAQDLEYILRKDVEAICAERLGGRKAGSEGERMAAEYLYNRLSAAGLTMLCGREGDKFSIVKENGDTIRSCNVVGILEGYDAVLREEYIVVATKIDHLGAFEVMANGKVHRQIYAGADAQASGMAALVSVAEMLAGERLFLKRSVIFIGVGSSEEEFAGARYFLSGFSDAQSKIKLMVCLDMLGRGNGANPFRIFSAANKNDIKSMMDYVIENESVTTVPAVGSGTINASDHVPFHQQNIPTVIFTTGISKEYRTVRDVSELIDYGNLAAESIYIEAFVKSMAEKNVLFPSKSVVNQDVEQKYYAASDCDVRPRFFHNSEQYFLDAWVYKYLKYPDAAVRNGIQGVVYVSFIVEKDGKVTNVVVEKGVDPILDEAAVKVVAVSPKWSAGEISKRKVRTKIVIPVEFRLTKGR